MLRSLTSPQSFRERSFLIKSSCLQIVHEQTLNNGGQSAANNYWYCENLRNTKRSWSDLSSRAFFDTIAKSTKTHNHGEKKKHCSNEIQRFYLLTSPNDFSWCSVGGHFSLSSHGVQTEHRELVSTSVSAKGPESSSHGGIPSIRATHERARWGYYTWIKTGRARLVYMLIAWRRIGLFINIIQLT